MSQAGPIDVTQNMPQIPTEFDADIGSAIPILNVLEVLGDTVANGAGPKPVYTSASGNTLITNVQLSAAIAATDVNSVGLAAFDSASFTVDANGFVSLLPLVAATKIGVDAFTGPGTNPVVPTAGGVITATGGQVAAGTTANVIQTNSLAANTFTIQIQRSAAVGSSTIGSNGVSHFDSAAFDVDSNGFVQLNGGGIAVTSFSPNSGTDPVVPTAAGLVNIKGTGSLTVVGSLNTLTPQLTGLTNHNVLVGAGTATITNVSPSTSGFVLTSNGVGADPSFQSVSASGAITTITGNSGGAESPSAGNFNIVGTGSITVAGSANTETVQLTGLTNHNVLIGAGTATITNVAPSATSGVPLISNGAAADPSFGTAVVAGGGTGATSFTAYAVICGGTTSTGTLQSIAGVGTSGQVLTSNGAGALPTFQAASTGSAFTSIVVQTFTADGTYTPTANMKYCTIEVVGGGGAGGGSTAGGSGTGSIGGGGGGGGYARKTVTAATIGASKSVSVGAGGTANSAAAGGNGGTSSVGSIVSATGGTGGSSSSVGGVASGAGGAGGAGSSGDVNSSGGAGGYGGTFSGGSGAFSGSGGCSYFGAGAGNIVNFTLASANIDGIAGSVYGGGGSGSSSNTLSLNGTGGAGGAGIVIITEFI
jgi:hypothetical protein